MVNYLEIEEFEIITNLKILDQHEFLILWPK